MKYIKTFCLKNKNKKKEFKIYKINRFETHILKKLHHQILIGVPKKYDFPYNYKRMKEDLKINKDYFFIVYNKLIPVAYCRIERICPEDYPISSKKLKGLCDHYKLKSKQLFFACDVNGSGVISKYRGFGLQKYLLDFREEFARSLECKYLFTSCHPENKYSIKNILKTNFKKQNSFKDTSDFEKILFIKYIK
jgi:GNAT superfamily N-acetyltransferase